MDYREGGTPRNTKETKNIDSQLGIQLVYDWRAFKPHEYIAHPAIHNTGIILTQRGIRPRFKSFERVGESTERSYVDFQQIPHDIPYPPPK